MTLIIPSQFIPRLISPHWTGKNDKKRIVFLTDADFSLIAWEKGGTDNKPVRQTLESNLQAINQFSSHMAVAGVITGRGLKSSRFVGNHLDGFPDLPIFLSTDNGKGKKFFSPEKNGKFPTWESHENIPEWDEFLKANSGWSQEDYILILQKVLLKEAYIISHDINYPDYEWVELNPESKTSDKPDKICYMQDQASLFCFVPDEKNLKKHSDYLLKLAIRIAREFSDNKLHNLIPKMTVNPDNVYINFSLEPKDITSGGLKINKSTSAAFIMHALPPEVSENISAVILVGDALNDDHMLLHEIRKVCGTVVPTYAIFSGRELQPLDGFKDHPRAIFTDEKANIGQAIADTFAELQRQYLIAGH